MNETKNGIVGLQFAGATGKHPTADKSVREESLWRIENLVEQIWKELGGAVPCCEIDSILREIAPAYENARVQTFVPIFLRRDATDRLKNKVATAYSAPSFEHDRENIGGATDSINGDMANERKP